MMRRITVSDIENGKLEINVSSLVLFAIELEKPVSYFFAESIFRNFLVDIKNESEHELLSHFKEIEHVGNADLTLRIVALLEEYSSEENNGK